MADQPDIAPRGDLTAEQRKVLFAGGTERRFMNSASLTLKPAGRGS